MPSTPIRIASGPTSSFAENSCNTNSSSGQIKTTKAKAKAVRKEVERIITLAKDGSLAARRKALGYLYDKQLVHSLFAAAKERYGDRPGGYTRVVRTVRRRGDNAEMAIIELV